MTTTDVAQYEPETSPEAGTLELLPPRQSQAVASQQMLRAHAQMMQDAWQLAEKMCNTTMVPTRFLRKPEDGTAAILYGAELGLNPIQSLQRVIPIHGMPSIEGRTMQALLQNRGYKFRWVEKSDTRCELIGWNPKDPESVENPERSVWTIDRAIRAEYVPTIDDKTGKYRTNGNGKLLGNMKYITDPQAMLKAKCQSEVCRDLDPAVLMGISYTTEDLESESWDDRGSGSAATSERAASAPITVGEILGDDLAEEAPAKPKRTRPSGTRPRKPEPPEEPQDAEVVDDAPAAPEPADPPSPAPAPEPAADEAAPADTAPEAPPAEPEADADAGSGPAGDDDRAKMIRHLFALFGKAQTTDREDRLVIYRKVLQRPEIGSTNDLSDDDLEFIIGGLQVLDKRGDLAEYINEELNRAALAELDAQEAAAAQAADTTTPKEN